MSMSASTTIPGATIPGATIPGTAKDPVMARALGRRRHRTNAVVKVACVFATAIGLLLLASILFTLLWRGVGG